MELAVEADTGTKYESPNQYCLLVDVIDLRTHAQFNFIRRIFTKKNEI